MLRMWKQAAVCGAQSLPAPCLIAVGRTAGNTQAVVEYEDEHRLVSACIGPLNS
ncbi:hypothetical protein PGT21_015133 [Puccinia graminis f. sp. tritici]|uniref:Uncharacterized protein n=1 Tax=Puccinia graminis f. sp. tritici TaxID=56615 RepID=A0A5B0LLW2_PUCGR|nr:hypothetical protein PGT21_015133 [Puccinia graminis f. sp. tritici]KAA1069920.1 hypothetical protein PGTUg99_002272 [Puccinia graminis f. sp. tritici]KAA1130556.1 hypothetical protein PGTUg99_021414 [Puccinia graminis f. sp. tritici]